MPSPIDHKARSLSHFSHILSQRAIAAHEFGALTRSALGTVRILCLGQSRLDRSRFTIVFLHKSLNDRVCFFGFCQRLVDQT